jgi:hypothetical protein
MMELSFAAHGYLLWREERKEKGREKDWGVDRKTRNKLLEIAVVVLLQRITPYLNYLGIESLTSSSSFSPKSVLSGSPASSSTPPFLAFQLPLRTDAEDGKTKPNLLILLPLAAVDAWRAKRILATSLQNQCRITADPISQIAV